MIISSLGTEFVPQWYNSASTFKAYPSLITQKVLNFKGIKVQKQVGDRYLVCCYFNHVEKQSVFHQKKANRGGRI